jgi:hypothetical protein
LRSITIYRFVFPYTDGRLYQRAITGSDLQAAYETFIRVHWHPSFPAVGVWHGSQLAARVISVFNDQTSKLEPALREIP